IWRPPWPEFPRPPSPTEGAGGTASKPSPEPAPENKPARWAASEPPAPPRDGGGGTTCTPALESEPPDNEPPRPSPAELPAFSIACTDGGGGTTPEPAPDSRPARPVPRAPEPVTLGGGGTANPARPPSPDWSEPEIVRCSPTGNRGAGATTTTAAGPILMSPTSPTLLIEACKTGGGPTTAAPGTVTARLEDSIPTWGAGATPEACGKPRRRDVPWLTSGGGATIAVGLEGPLNREDPVEASGIAGRTEFEAAMLGRAGPFSLM